MSSLDQKKEARWYQTEAKASVFDYFEEKNGNPLICLPTGSGKSFVIADLLYDIFTMFPWQRVLVATHVKELIGQNHKAMLEAWPDAPAGIYSAGLGEKNFSAPIIFGGVASLVNAIDLLGKIDLLFIDEAHLLGPSSDGMYMRLIDGLRTANPKLKVIGLTATWWRTGMGVLTNGDIFTDICYNICDIPGFKRLFADGHLVPPRAKRQDNVIDTSGVGMANGDFNKGGLNEVTRNEKITWAALNESLNKNPDRRQRLVFCTGVDHAVMAADMLRVLGLRAAAVHSKMSSGERDDVMGAYLSGELDALTNNGIATTGLNHPPIDHIIMLRPTMSVGLWVQMIGRGTRPFTWLDWIKLDCIISDHAGNAKRLGPIDDPYVPKQKGKGGGVAPVKICPVCDTYNHTSARVCEYCGEPFEIKVGYYATAREDVIVRSDLPVIETIGVRSVFYTQYLAKNPGPMTKPTIKASYNCDDGKTYFEYITIEATGFLGKKARDWWRQRNNADVPASTNAAMETVDKSVKPKAIKVWTNKRYPEITGYEW